MKVKVIIEEFISQSFEVEVSSPEKAYEEIRDKYRGGILELNNAAVLEANVSILDENGQANDWERL